MLRANPAGAAMVAPTIRGSTRHGDHPRGPRRCRATWCDRRVPPSFRGRGRAQELRGLNPAYAGRGAPARHRRLLALAVDFLSPIGGTPTDNEDKAREMIGTLDPARSSPTPRPPSPAQGAARQQRQGRHRRLLPGAAAWSAESQPRRGPRRRRGLLWPGARHRDGSRDQGALLLNYAGLDERINAGVPAFEAALKRRRDLHALHV